MTPRALTLWPLLAALSCGGPPEDTGLAEEGLTLLSPRERLIRLSTDLLGRHPGEDELAAIEAHPALYDDFVDRYLDDPRFLDRVEELFNRHYRTRTGETFFDPAEAGLGMVDPARVADSVGDEPLKLIRHVVEHGLPWTELVTADYTLADPLVAAMWGLEREPGPGWTRARYIDGRPHAGVLSQTTLWLRYPSAGVNANRHRANTVSRVLLCDDYLARPVSFSRSQIDALTSGDPEDVIRDTPTCQSCHSSLDPLSAHFFGFWWEIDADEDALEAQTLYRPEDEALWWRHAGREPGYFGLPTANLVELGQAIASDRRFVECAVRQTFEGLTQREVQDEDWEELAAHIEAFEASGLTFKALVASIVTSPRYLAAAAQDAALAERLTVVKTASPWQLAGVIEGITGHRWTFGGREALLRNDLGLAVLAGGLDSRYVTTPNHDPSVGLALVHERLAQAAAHAVAARDLDPAREGEAVLLAYVTIEDRPETSPEAFEAQIRALYLAATGLPLPADAPEPAALMDLWKQLYSVEGSAEAAWAGLVSVALRDPRVLFY